MNLFEKMALLLGFAVPGIAVAQQTFTYSNYGDVLAGFRKTGIHQGNYELVVNIGNITNFLALSAGSSLSISNYSSTQLADAFPDGNDNLQWSVSSAFRGIGSWVTPGLTFPAYTIWVTLPRTNANIQTPPLPRYLKGQTASVSQSILAIGNNAAIVSGSLGATNADNNAVLVREPIADSSEILTAFIGDQFDPTLGDFGGQVFNFSVENITPSPFVSAVVSDLYQMCPRGSLDPITRATNGACYFVGYFTLKPDGTMTFTRASTTATVPAVSSVSPSPVIGSSFPQVLTISGINFTLGCSALLTNTYTQASFNPAVTFNGAGSLTVSNVFGTAAGNWTVTVMNPGNVASTSFAFSVTAPSRPSLSQPSFNVGGTQITLSGAGGAANLGYRVLGATNPTLSISQWTSLQTNSFASDGSFSCTLPVDPTQPQYFYLIQP
jgi:hypothetical protein